MDCHPCVAEKCKQLILRTNISVLYYIQTSQYLDWLLLFCLKAVFAFLKETMHFIFFSGVIITHFCTLPPSHGETKIRFFLICVLNVNMKFYFCVHLNFKGTFFCFSIFERTIYHRSEIHKNHSTIQGWVDIRRSWCTNPFPLTPSSKQG